MAYVIKVVGFANGQKCPIAGLYCKKFDFEAKNGKGLGLFTSEIDDALRFPDAGAAVAFWKTQSTTRPLRADGRPNRPFTSSTVEMVRVNDQWH